MRPNKLPKVTKIDLDAYYVEDKEGVPTAAIKGSDLVASVMENAGTVKSAESIIFSVRNDTGAAMNAYRPVQLSADHTEGPPSFGYCQANYKSTCTNLIVLLEDIPIGGTGKAIRAGLHTNIDTSNLEGGKVYFVSADSPSLLTTVDPSYPNLSCRLFKCLVSDEEKGSIDVAIDADPNYQQGTASTAEQMETMSIALTNKSTQAQSGSDTQWSMTASMLLPKDIINISTSSKLTCYITQGSGDFMMAIYKKNVDHSLTRIAYTPAITKVAEDPLGFYASSIIVDAPFSAGDTLYFAFLTSANSVYLRGITSFTSNVIPYVNGRKTNMGVITVPPENVVFDGEFANALYMELKR